MSIMPSCSFLGMCQVTMPARCYHCGRFGLVCLEWIVGSGAHVLACISGTKQYSRRRNQEGVVWSRKAAGNKAKGGQVKKEFRTPEVPVIL